MSTTPTIMKDGGVGSLLNARFLGRIAILGFGVFLVQVAIVSQLTVFGVTADLMPLIVAAVGLLCGSMPGAMFGFALGLFVDAALLQTMGLSSLCYLTVGYGAGRLREVYDPQGALTPIAVGAAATAVTTVGYGLMRFLLGDDTPVSWLLLVQTILIVAVGALIALPVLVATRRFLLPALPDDPRRRRRRASTTGGLSPFTQA